MNIKKKRLLTISCFISMTIFPISSTIANPILVKISETLGRELVSVGYIFTFLSVGVFIGAASSGVICKFFSRNIFLKTLYLLQIVSFLMISFIANLYIFYLSFFILGLAAGFISVQMSVLISEIYSGKAGFYLNILHMFYGVGAFIGPMLHLLSGRSGFGLRGTFLFASALCLFNLLFSLLIRIPDSDECIKNKQSRPAEKPGTLTGFRSMKANFGLFMLVLLVISIAFAIASREGINYWIPSYLVLEKNFDNYSASRLLSYFWIITVAGRFSTGFLSKVFKTEKILFFLGILQFLVMMAAIFTNSVNLIFVFVVAAGFLNAGFFPSILAISNTYYHKNKSLVTSILTSIGGIGGFAATGIISIAYKYFNLQTGLIMVSCLIIGVSAIMLVINFKFRPSGNLKD